MQPLTSEETGFLLGGILMFAVLVSVVGTLVAAWIRNIIEKYREEHRDKRD
jgi:hypothetical protein